MPRAASQPGLFETEPLLLPEGFRYQPELIGPEDEQVLHAWFQTLDFQPYVFQGYLANRRVVSFGFRYDDTTRRVSPADPIPDQLQPLRARAAAFAGMETQDLQHVLINEYRPGAPIGWHRDRPQFEAVVGVSLLSPATFRLRRKQGSGWERRTLEVQPRSAYVMQGPARWEWEHSIPPAEQLRYSVTFRSMRQR
jgi:alkylated DNA repair dioxygenase AlkB